MEKLAIFFDAEPLPDYLTPDPSWNVAPSQWVPVVVETAAHGVESQSPETNNSKSSGHRNQDLTSEQKECSVPRHFRLMQWGLLPFWAKTESQTRRPINARSETAAEKPMFRKALRSRRCIIPADGWYEWQQNPAGKQPHHLFDLQGRTLALGGLWESWSGAEGAQIESFTILTTQADASIVHIHNRMPLLFQPSEWAAWLSPRTTEQEVQQLLVSSPAAQLDYNPVSRDVNSTANNGPQLFKPIPTL